MQISLKEKLSPFFKSLNKNTKKEDYELCFKELDKALKIGKLTYCVLNQILHLFNEAGISKDFFKYYFNNTNIEHIYSKSKIKNHSASFDNVNISEENLIWGLHCFTIDALFVFGNIKSAYKMLRNKSHNELIKIFKKHLFHHKAMVSRSKSIILRVIEKDERYFLSEIVNNNFQNSIISSELENISKIDPDSESIRTSIGNLKSSTSLDENQLEVFKNITSSFDVDLKVSDHKNYYDKLFNKHEEIQKKGEVNNKLYLSQVNEIDIYIATSMRTKDDFNKAFDFVNFLEKHNKLSEFKLRIFDPTNCVAKNPYDKGLTECLMVKCSKVLIYIASEDDSYGKDAEAAIALSLGKPVIMLCSEPNKHNLMKNIHPLSRLINIETGVACGAIITDNKDNIPELLYRIFKNEMEYEFKTNLNGNEMQYIEELVTGSCIRLETSDKFLSAAFWNNYHDEI